jgi:hypothetical protein
MTQPSCSYGLKPIPLQDSLTIAGQQKIPELPSFSAGAFANRQAILDDRRELFRKRDDTERRITLQKAGI